MPVPAYLQTKLGQSMVLSSILGCMTCCVMPHSTETHQNASLDRQTIFQHATYKMFIEDEDDNDDIAVENPATTDTACAHTGPSLTVSWMVHVPVQAHKKGNSWIMRCLTSIMPYRPEYAPISLVRDDTFITRASTIALHDLGSAVLGVSNFVESGGFITLGGGKVFLESMRIVVSGSACLQGAQHAIF
eukprot:2336407-Amphidinium_carterae.1